MLSNSYKEVPPSLLAINNSLILAEYIIDHADGICPNKLRPWF
jgi:hypothetical protein